MEPTAPFVPAAFDPPPGLTEAAFVLEPLGPRHNEADYAAWSTSIAHIRATPGYADSSWPHEMSSTENLADLERHERDFVARSGFTYTVLDSGDGDVVGCVYIYPLRSRDGDADARPSAGGASVHSWVRANRAELDVPLWQAVGAWLEAEWPFECIDYAPRG